ncbi:protein SCO1/2 [Cohaesibacter sp. ES.047]|uniref:SCO family protein n=1 Tax=Cohaesibacter sp. ES.047 TaxID=1798205 RepID=UPI000BB8D63A|nr:SCO family protein [Cohaesibacter sp. ES.047]SNY92514.1 protein SCO1/2 [Cohaesibacter sp. ES.047]
MKKILRILLWGLVILVAAALAYMIFNWYQQELGVQQTQSGDTSVPIGGDFQLTDHTGKPVTAADFSDKPMVVYFGYTFCPDVCPTTLSEMTLWVEDLGEDADKLNYLFITVDPERDDQEAMAYYVDAFFPQLVGLRGTPEQTKDVIKAYRVYAKKVEEEDGGDNYVMDHTASVYLMKKGNIFSGTIAYGEEHDTAVAKLRKLIATAE